MSRSFKKTPIIGNAGGSDKLGKRKANRALRRAVNIYLAGNKDPEAVAVPALREVSNVWNFAKDGKHYISHIELRAKYCRK